ncbi:hypothetical protein ABN242_14935 [Providencia alcalifaciens]|uniref:hypothetical protein n=2 Tax=Providencia TaxID=586 RepID=UPI0032D9BE52
MEKSYSKLTDKLSTVIAILNRIKIYENNSKNIDYKAFYLYVESLVKFFNYIIKNSIYEDWSKIEEISNHLDNIIKGLGAKHLPKVKLDRFIRSITEKIINQDFYIEINLLLSTRNKYYPDAKKNIININPNLLVNKGFINENNKLVNLSSMELKLEEKFNEILSIGKIKIDKTQENLEEKASEILLSLQKETSDLKAEAKVSMTGQLDSVKNEYTKIFKEMKMLFSDIELYKGIISDETKNEVSKHYAEKSKREMYAYWIMTLISIIIIGGALISAWTGLSDYYNNYVNISNDVNLDTLRKTAEYAKIYLIFRLVLSVLLFLTVLYTSKIAYRSYVHWRHSESMKLKLSSLSPFINQLDPHVRKQIHKELVPDYFGKDAGVIDVATKEKFKDFPTNVSSIVMKAMDNANGAFTIKTSEEVKNK